MSLSNSTASPRSPHTPSDSLPPEIEDTQQSPIVSELHSPEANSHSSQVWRSLLAERMARHDNERHGPVESLDRTVEDRRRERDASLRIATEAGRREREAQRNVRIFE